jgi:hypothetical protein
MVAIHRRKPRERGKRRFFNRNPLCALLAPALAAALAVPIYGSANMGRDAPEISGKNWLNSKPLSMAQLKGRVVLIEFWTYG